MNAVHTIDATRPNQKRKVSLMGVLSSVIILYNIVPIVSQLVSDYTTTYAYMALVVLVVGFILLQRSLSGFLEALLFLMPLILHEVLTYFINSDTLVMWGYGVLISLLPMLLGFYFIKVQTDQERSFSFPMMRKVLIFSLIVSLITTCIGLLRYPQAARTLATIASSDSPILRTYNYANIGGYHFVYTVVLLYPFLILAHKEKKIGRFVTILGAVAAFALAILSEYTTAFLLLVLSSLFLFFPKKLSVKRVLWFALLGLVLLFLLGTLFSRIFLWLADVIDGESISARLRDLSKGWTGFATSEDPRLQLYLRSLSAFAQKPLWGWFLSARGARNVGGHSFLLDSLGLYGLIGAALLFWLYRIIYRTFFKPYQDRPSYGYVFWVFVQTLILSLVNTGSWLWVLCFFSPLLLSWIYSPKPETAKVLALDLPQDKLQTEEPS